MCFEAKNALKSVVKSVQEKLKNYKRNVSGGKHDIEPDITDNHRWT